MRPAPAGSKIAATAAAVAAVLVLSACGGPPARRQATPPPAASLLPPTLAGPAETGASITVGLPGATTNWNPLAATGSPGPGAGIPDPVRQTVTDAVLPSAFVVGPSLTPLLDHQIVTSAAVTATDPQTVTYQINPKATWSDGVPLTAADFAYTWQADSGRAAFRDVGGAAYTPASTTGYADVTSVRGGNAGRTVVVTFASPDPAWQALFSPILPAHVGQAVGFDHGFTNPVRDLVSAGPMVVQSYEPGVAVTLVRNPAWWGPPSQLSTVTVDFVSDPSVAGASLLTGQLDAALLTFTPGAAKALRATPGLSVATQPSAVYDDLILDERVGPFTQAVARRAVLLAVDRSALAELADTHGDVGALPVGNRAFLPGEPGYSNDSADLGQGGLAAARSLLAGAGFTLAGTTLLDPAGHPVAVRLLVAVTSPLTSLEVTSVVSACHSLGMAVSEQVVAGASALTALRAKGWNLAIVPEAVGTFPSSLAQIYGSGAAGNLTGYSSATMDALLARLAAEPAGPARQRLADQVDAQAWAGAVDLPLMFEPQLWAAQTRYTGIGPAPGPAGPAWDIARWALPAGT